MTREQFEQLMSISMESQKILRMFKNVATLEDELEAKKAYKDFVLDMEDRYRSGELFTSIPEKDNNESAFDHLVVVATWANEKIVQGDVTYDYRN